ncbi:MAG TPA: alpha/beta hydrolase [Pseudonocardiaceae bacterium]|jgi:pimeloyl-ACP methyl ester carboxylesterase
MSVGERVTPWDPAARHRFVTSDGTALHVEESGAGRVTVVLAHGWTLDNTSWDRVAAALTGVRVLRYDHRGHGGSAPARSGTASVAQAADDLAELIVARVPDGPVVLVGHSMGGMAAMALAERHPELFAERIAAVGLVATSAGDLDKLTLGLPDWLGRRVAAMERRVNGRIARRSGGALLRRPGVAVPGLRWLLFGSGAARADVLATAAQVGRCHPRSMVEFRASLNEHERRAALAALREVPVVVLAGGVDRLTPVAHARAIAAELPSAELVVFPGAGHMLPYERDTDVAAHLTRLVALV